MSNYAQKNRRWDTFNNLYHFLSTIPGLFVHYNVDTLSQLPVQSSSPLLRVPLQAAAVFFSVLFMPYRVSSICPRLSVRVWTAGDYRCRRGDKTLLYRWMYGLKARDSLIGPIVAFIVLFWLFLSISRTPRLSKILSLQNGYRLLLITAGMITGVGAADSFRSIALPYVWTIWRYLR